jgi:hypothetical protein
VGGPQLGMPCARQRLRCSGPQILLLYLAAASRTNSQKITCLTSAGDLTIRLHKEWAPRGHARLLELVQAKFFDNQAVYSTNKGQSYMFGVGADSAAQSEWQTKTILDDDVRHHALLRSAPAVDYAWLTARGFVTSGCDQSH